jgi:hypothetical protein
MVHFEVGPGIAARVDFHAATLPKLSMRKLLWSKKFWALQLLGWAPSNGRVTDTTKVSGGISYKEPGCSVAGSGGWSCNRRDSSQNLVLVGAGFIKIDPG